ncbi:hypothetical protein FC093_11650 [Ilyomonas limi]|jgi:hypothetical protein|uniref:Uncharacterized protein n=1 Tax=Ilyomonas limi TaxID=2575867 RepID=A0A4U3L0M0_9BACT|nr:hypothetical protein [Ilyomonas limi]TKK68282.1 hypothetical protein FC093_11650 [Ilyomonas limi]
MRTLKRITTLTIIILSAAFCLAQFSPKKTAPICEKRVQEAAATSISDAEDFSLINLLTLKFM